jgi:hypothetical protein
MESIETLVAAMKRANAKIAEVRKAMEASKPEDMAAHKPALDAATNELDAAVVAIQAAIEAADDSEAARRRFVELVKPD